MIVRKQKIDMRICIVYYLVFFGVLGACTSQPKVVEQGASVNLYTNVYQVADLRILAAFERSSGIKVNVIAKEAPALIQRIATVVQDSSADLILLDGIVYLQAAKQRNLFRAIDPLRMEAILPARYCDADQHWWGLQYRMMGIAFVRDSLPERDSFSYDLLTRSRWKGQVLVDTKTSVSLVATVAGMLANEDETTARQWVKDYYANLTDTLRAYQRKSLIARMNQGVGTLALLGTDRYADKLTTAPQIGIALPNQSTPNQSESDVRASGAYIDVVGIGLGARAAHPEYAYRLLNYLVNAEVAAAYAQSYYTYPVRRRATTSESLPSLESFRHDTTSVTRLAEFSTLALALLAEADSTWE